MCSVLSRSVLCSCFVMLRPKVPVIVRPQNTLGRNVKIINFKMFNWWLQLTFKLDV